MPDALHTSVEAQCLKVERFSLCDYQRQSGEYQESRGTVQYVETLTSKIEHAQKDMLVSLQHIFKPGKENKILEENT